MSKILLWKKASRFVGEIEGFAGLVSATPGSNGTLDLVVRVFSHESEDGQCSMFYGAAAPQTKPSPKSPDFKGTVTLDGKQMQITLWLRRKASNQEEFLSGVVEITEAEVEETPAEIDLHEEAKKALPKAKPDYYFAPAASLSLSTKHGLYGGILARF